MAEICCSETSASCEPRSRAARRRRMDIRRFKFIAGEAPEFGSDPCSSKRQKLEVSYPATSSRECENAVESSERQEAKQTEAGEEKDNLNSKSISIPAESPVKECFPKFGMTSVIGRRRDMEDAVSIHPFFCQQDRRVSPSIHFFGVFDGHGCSHVATRCKERMHNLVAEELERQGDWKESMERSFSNMDGEVTGTGNSPLSNCRCELQSPKCDAVGSTAVVAVVSPEKIVVANCGDSRAVLCRNGKAVPLSSDHKPDRPDELERIQAAGGRVIYWDGPRVLGVLAMSRAIGDTYLKPFVSSIPEVTVTERSPDDECLILASDGLWDVVSNDTACDIAGMCLRGQSRSSPESESSSGAGGPDKVCSDAAMLLTKLALARQSSDNVSVVVVDLHKEI